MPADAGDFVVSLIDPYFGSRTVVTPLKRIMDELPDDSIDADVIVLRGIDASMFEEETIDLDALASTLAQRTSRVSVAIGLIAPEPANNHKLKIEIVAGQFEGSLPPEVVRDLETRAHIERTGAVHKPTDAHFQLPSGVHAAIYIRAADIFDDIWVVRRLADWLQDRVTQKTVLLSDTWTILPLLQELAQRSKSDEVGSGTPIVTFSEYPSLEDARNKLAEISTLLGSTSDGRVLAIISVVSSGRLLTLWQNLLAELVPGSTIDIVALINTSGEHLREAESITQMEGISRFDTSVENCALCQNPDISTIIQIDERRYFPEIYARKILQMLDARVASTHKNFWELASRTDAIRVHSSDTTKDIPRHLHIDIDIGKLLTDASFQEDVEKSLREFCQDCDLIIVPKHPSTEAIVALAKRIFPAADVVIVPRSSFSSADTQDDANIVAELQRALESKKNILILDDVVVQGKTIRALHTLLQRCILASPVEKRPDPRYQIRAFAVIARPETPDRWNILSDSLRQDGRTVFLGKHLCIYLPEFDCPWCREADLIASVLATDTQDKAIDDTKGLTSAELSVLNARLARLRPIQGETSQGLDHALFLCDASGKTDQSQNERLTLHSLFGEELTEVVAYTAVAAAMHQLRLKAKRISLQNGHSWVWDIPKIIGAYHDAILQASFLRAAHPSELLYSDREKLADALRSIMNVSEERALQQHAMVAAEHKYALLSGKYPAAFRYMIAEYVDPVLNAWDESIRDFLNALQDRRNDLL
jgi:hypoxanthine-guanine phosphoribosyltransferase